MNSDDYVGRLTFGDHQGFAGAPVYVYDGDNAETIVAAIGLEPGDVVVSPPGSPPIIMKAESWRLFTEEIAPPRTIVR